MSKNERVIKVLLLVITFLIMITAGLLSFPQKEYILHIMVLASILSVMSLSFNLQLGYLGILNLGMYGIFGVGAYTFTLLANTGCPVIFALIAAGLLSGAIGAAIGAVSLRTSGMYFAITTLMIGVVLYMIFSTWTGLTHGFQGITGIPTLLGSGITKQYFLAISFLIFSGLLFYKISRSRFGRVLRGIKDDEKLAKAIGFKTNWYKVTAIALACLITGIAGGIYAQYMGFIGPEFFNYLKALYPVIYTLFGGVGTILGPIIGTFCLILSLQVLYGMQNYQMVVFGLMIVFILIFLPNGVYGSLKEKFSSIF